MHEALKDVVLRFRHAALVFGLFVMLGCSGVMAAQSVKSGPIVSVTGGKVQGRLLDDGGGAVFKGIPFAQPPVGDLRWHEPMPVKVWQGTRDAGEYGSPCAQGGTDKIGTSSKEDCLCLNVWTPEWPSKSPKAVMFWLYGGANTGGSAIGERGIEPAFDGTSLARHGVVVVTINYRLGLFGFIGHPELTAESPHHASGNYGLMDQIAALKWVRENIARFGGDPGNVTIFGQSAGAQNLTILMTSPLTKGLFRRAISESGTPMISDKRLPAPAEIEKLGLKLAELLKAPATGAIKYLRSLPAADILAVAPSFRGDPAVLLDVGMDGYVVPRFSPKVFQMGQESTVPLMIGTNGAESGLPRSGAAAAAPSPVPAADAFKTRVESFYGKYPDLLTRALEVYGLTGDGSQVSTYSPYYTANVQCQTDTSFRCEAVVLAGWHSAANTTYQYEFTGGTPSNAPTHSAELKYVFGLLGDQSADPAAILICLSLVNRGKASAASQEAR